jgi:hypothetical protein
MRKSIMHVGLDVHKDSIEITTAETGRGGEVRRFGQVGGDLASLDKAVRKLQSKGATCGSFTKPGPAVTSSIDISLRRVWNATLAVSSNHQAGKLAKEISAGTGAVSPLDDCQPYQRPASPAPTFNVHERHHDGASVACRCHAAPFAERTSMTMTNCSGPPRRTRSSGFQPSFA